MISSLIRSRCGASTTFAVPSAPPFGSELGCRRFFLEQMDQALWRETSSAEEWETLTPLFFPPISSDFGRCDYVPFFFFLASLMWGFLFVFFYIWHLLAWRPIFRFISHSFLRILSFASRVSSRGKGLGEVALARFPWKTRFRNCFFLFLSRFFLSPRVSGKLFCCPPRPVSLFAQRSGACRALGQRRLVLGLPKTPPFPPLLLPRFHFCGFSHTASLGVLDNVPFKSGCSRPWIAKRLLTACLSPIPFSFFRLTLCR